MHISPNILDPLYKDYKKLIKLPATSYLLEKMVMMDILSTHPMEMQK